MSVPTDRARPNVAGDLPTVFQAAPMFRRTVAGYDRFQVDTYVAWAEDELATADREREHLLSRHVRTRAALEEARELLSHSPGGAEVTRLSARIGSMLAAAADEATGIRADAEADRCAAAHQAERMIAEAERVLADAEAEAELLVADAVADAADLHVQAGRIVDEAELSAAEVRVEVEARWAKVRQMELRAAEQAGRTREQAGRDAAAARLQARDEVVRMLDTGREARRRADEAAAAIRARQEQEAATRYAALAREVAALEQRRSALRAEIESLGAPVADDSVGFLEHLRRRFERFGGSRSLRTP
jgi:hypothetical protein